MVSAQAWSRYGRRGTTKQRGLGWRDHASKRQTALATMTEGQLCARCELHGIVHPLTRAFIGRSADGKRWVAPMLDLDDFPGRAVGGPQVKRLSHRYCNRADGGRRAGNRYQWSSARDW